VRIFDFDPAEHREHYRRHGWVHIPGGIDPEFLEHLRAFAAASLDESKLDAFAIRGKKEQSLFTFPPEADYPGELFDRIAELCDLDRPAMTLSERHIQIYDPGADPEPPAHKDRFASQVSVGFSIDIPEESRLVLYPEVQRSVNPFNTSAGLRASLHPHELPEVVLRRAPEVVIADRPGDIVAFQGNSTWHLRRNAAGAINLYVKLNDFDCDPLGEDPRTPERRERSLSLLGDEARFAGLVPLRSRRLDTVTHEETRAGVEVLRAQVFGDDPFPLTAAQLELLHRADGGTTVAELVDSVATDGADERRRLREDVAALVRLGAIDLVEAR
jgi:hypothetical protein